jgi:cytochrome P450
MILELIWILTKYALYLVLGLVAYFVYELGIKPWRERRYYSQFANVTMKSNFVPLMGDFQDYIQDIKNDRPHYHKMIETATEVSKYDFRLTHENKRALLVAQSEQARKEMKALIPSKIDREVWLYSFGKLMLKSCVSEKSTKNNMERLKLFLQELSINSSSRHIPIMLKAMKRVMGNWEEGKTYELIHEMTTFTFTSFTMILFGKDAEDIVFKKMQYEDENYQMRELTMYDYFFSMSKDFLMEWVNPKEILFPFLSLYNLCEPFRKNQRNLRRFKDQLREMLENTKDETSVCKSILRQVSYDKDKLIDDFVLFLFGGAETTAHCLVSTLYYLKHPKNDSFDESKGKLSQPPEKQTHRVYKKLLNTLKKTQNFTLQINLINLTT